MDLRAVIQSHHDLAAIINLLRGAGGRCYLVGGCVRDALLGQASANFDLEVFGLSSQQIIDLCRPHYAIDLVGKSYGILKIRQLDIDIGVPRREVKTGNTHVDFQVHEAPDLPVEEAIRRRDFTINSIYYDLENDSYIDPFHGRRDLEQKVLRHTSERFVEDPLRVLRGMQFCARFDLTPSPETVALCQTLSPEYLSAERIYQEFVKLLLQGEVISKGLSFLKATGWSQFFPELHAMIGLKQDPVRHPEGDAYQHICNVLDAFAHCRMHNRNDDLTLGFALLCHDFGKATTTFQDEKGTHAYWHEIIGILPAKNFMERLGVPKEIMIQALTLVQYHMEPRRFFKRNASDADLRRLAYNVRRLDLLALVGYCDCYGRVDHNEAIRDWLYSRAKELGILKAPPKAIVQGRHLVSIGIAPNKSYSRILMKAYFAQLNGDFDTLEDGLAYVRKLSLAQPTQTDPETERSSISV
ncbi:MAG: HD domain-containing protein [Opitutales bacterium]|nr:HD domain-containing protein [Opitutales bacterium]